MGKKKFFIGVIAFGALALGAVLSRPEVSEVVSNAKVSALLGADRVFLKRGSYDAVSSSLYILARYTTKRARNSPRYGLLKWNNEAGLGLVQKSIPLRRPSAVVSNGAKIGDCEKGWPLVSGSLVGEKGRILTLQCFDPGKGQVAGEYRFEIANFKSVFSITTQNDGTVLASVYNEGEKTAGKSHEKSKASLSLISLNLEKSTAKTLLSKEVDDPTAIQDELQIQGGTLAGRTKEGALVTCEYRGPKVENCKVENVSKLTSVALGKKEGEFFLTTYAEQFGKRLEPSRIFAGVADTLVEREMKSDDRVLNIMDVVRAEEHYYFLNFMPDSKGNAIFRARI